MSDGIMERAANLVFELEAFDGPLDLLLYLIKKDEVDIYDIPIAQITSQYLAYLEACRELNLEIAGEFLYMAAVLIRIKSQMLLPRPEDDEQWEDPRTELINALQEYRKIKNISSALEEMASVRQRRYARSDYTLFDIQSPQPRLVKLDITRLMIAFGDLMGRIPEKRAYDLEPVEITVEDRKEKILALLEKASSLEFTELFRDDFRKIVMVVTLIAILELVKEGVLRIEQAGRSLPVRVFMNRPVAEAVEEA
jgi:segregation and condensation protein A